MISMAPPQNYDAQWVNTFMLELQRELDSCMKSGRRIYFGENTGSELALIAPNGNRYIVTVDNDGTLTTTETLTV